MRAIILAAGMSSRLEELTINLPKCCLKVDGQITVLERNLLLLRFIGVEHVVIVTGHASGVISELVDKQKRNFLSISTLFNDHYHDRNNNYSLYLCHKYIDKDTLVMNSDLVISRAIFEKVAKQVSISDKSFMVVDDVNPVDEEAMKVRVVNNQILNVNKGMDLDQSTGEFLGFMRISDSDKQKFIESMLSLVERQSFDLYYEDALDEVMNELEMEILSTDGERWTEFDNADDLSVARSLAKELSYQLS